MVRIKIKISKLHTRADPWMPTLAPGSTTSAAGQIISSSICSPGVIMYTKFREILVLRKHAVYVFFIFITILTLPHPIILPSSGLDPSWNIGIHLAYLRNLKFGKDLVYTFGPLGFLRQRTLLNYNLWITSLFSSIFCHFLFIGSIFYIFKKLSAKWYYYVGLMPILMFFTEVSLDYKLVITSALLLYDAICFQKNTKKMICILTIVAFLLSAALLIKFIAFISFYLIFAFVIISLFTVRNLSNSLYLPAAFAAFLLLFKYTIQFDLWLFIKGGFELTREYSGTMIIQGPFGQLIVGFVCIIVLALLFLNSIIKTRRKLFIFFLLNLGTLFTAFKHGFVRHDHHVLIFLQIYLLFTYLLFVIHSYEYNLIKVRPFKRILIPLYIITIIILGVTLNRISPLRFTDNTMEKIQNYEYSASLIADPTRFDERVNEIREQIRSDYPLDPDVVQFIDDKTVDVFPWDIALCWGYDFNWSPRPVFQSYSAYTRYLDNINSQHFVGDQAPEVLLYSYKSIDGRYPIFDEPKTFRTILRHYNYVNRSGEFILLTRNATTQNVREEVIHTSTAEIGQFVPIPSYEKGYVFGDVDVKNSLSGSLKKLIFKPSSLYIQFKFVDGTYSQKYRFVSDVAKNGLFISQFVGSTNDLAMVFQGHLTRDIEGFIILAENPADYNKHVTVKFIGVPANVKIFQRAYRFSKPIPEKLHPQQTFILGVGTIKGESKPVIYEHPLPNGRSIIAFKNVTIPAKALLKFSIALDPNVWSPEKGDGVTFKIYIKENGTEKLIFSKYIDPKHNPEERKWNDYEVDLSVYAGNNVTLIFSTLPGPNNDTSWDWAWWGEPRIEVDS